MRLFEPEPAAGDILVVDDDPTLAGTLAEILRRHGYGVATAPHGRAAMQHVTRLPVSLVISDIFMPEGDGIELLNFLRARNPAPPLLAMSGAGEGQIVNMLKVAGALGAAHVLSKPFAPAQFLAIVRQLIGPPPGRSASPTDTAAAPRA